ncbi:DUF2239 family protein [Methylobacterium sp. C25]|uniref:DUF2239 family protein n=1 Tax=Methylobacterium sp. C25 TaxID=2721622 RepID=UPI001F17BF2B|nr:DUF2239 family protein [Methylobacterium sp. C25]MCE4223092.1 DUF2239 family protein [Methylobacterium sp. C25]
MATDERIYTAFHDGSRLARGAPGDVFVAVKALLSRDAATRVLVFDDATGRTVDADLRGSDDDVRARLAAPEPPARGPGRPKLGVVAREVTLLPRHWDWLGAQPGGASVALRRLVEEARRADSGPEERRRAQEVTDRFMATAAGDRPGYEAAARALYAGQSEGFAAAIAAWPNDLREHATHLAEPAFRSG